MINILTGPIIKIVDSVIDRLVPDVNLKRKLKADIEKSILNNEEKTIKAQRDIILAEYQHGGILTRNWRPALMILAGFIIAFYGLILPIFQTFGVGNEFTPMWGEVPDEVWQLLTWGIGAYIGGRSIEKISKNVTLISKERQKQQIYTHKKMENNNQNDRGIPK